MLILKDEHAIDVLNSGNIGHLWHDFHAIDVHATDVGDPMMGIIMPMVPFSGGSLREIWSYDDNDYHNYNDDNITENDRKLF